jgi:multidrug transporter EmrE-like cation transporter
MFPKDLSVLPLIFISVLLASGSQLVLKIGMTSPAVQDALAMRREGVIGPGSLLIGIGTHPAVLAGLFCFGLSAVVWLFVLSKIDVSQAYPCVALGIVLTVLGGGLLLGEDISLTRWLGLAVIVGGVGLVAASR